MPSSLILSADPVMALVTTSSELVGKNLIVMQRPIVGKYKEEYLYGGFKVGATTFDAIYITLHRDGTWSDYDLQEDQPNAILVGQFKGFLPDCLLLETDATDWDATQAAWAGFVAP